MTTRPYADVLAATREHVAGDDKPFMETFIVYWAVGKALDVDLHNQRTMNLRRDADRLYGQVARAMNAMAAEGTLVKVSKRDRHPDGSGSRLPAYYKPEQFEQARQEAARARAKYDAEQTRWIEIFDELQRFGFISLEARGRPVRLSPGDWETLLMAATGRL